MIKYPLRAVSVRGVKLYQQGKTDVAQEMHIKDPSTVNLTVNSGIFILLR